MVIEEKRLYSPKEVIAANGGILPMSLSGVYLAVNRKEIPVKKIGTRIFIPGKYLLTLLDEEN